MRIRRLIALVLLIVAAVTASAAEVRIGALSLNWLDGFTQASDSEPVRLTNADGVVVLISAYRVKDDPAANSGKALVERHVAFAQSQLPMLAAKTGTIVLPLSQENLINGMILFSTATKTSSLFASGFYLQYFLISPQGRIALFTVEGKGEPIAEHERYRPVFNTVLWP